MFASPFTAKLALRWFTYHRQSVEEALVGDAGLGRHSGVVVFSKGGQRWLTWSEASRRPFGQAIPFQCPGCKHLGTVTVRKSGPEEVEVHCKEVGCKYMMRFLRPKGSAWVRGSHSANTEGAWLATKDRFDCI
jgi:TPP-dependent indolepyruvate ferredoxin oxidoreductase alpha subunit